MQARIKVRSPIGRVLLAPTRTNHVELYISVGVPIFVQAGEGHNAPVPQGYNRGVPSSMERVVLGSPAIDECTSVREKYHAITKHVPGERKLSDSSCRWIPQQCS